MSTGAKTGVGPWNSEQLLGAVFQGTSDGILLADPVTGRIRMANDALAAMMRCTTDELCRLTTTDLRAPDSAGGAGGEAASAFGFDMLLRRRDGTLFHADVTSTSIALGRGDCLAWFVRDTSERRLAEQTLRDSEEKYRGLFEAERDAVVLVDAETCRILEANPAACRMYGFTREELLELKHHDLSAEPAESLRTLQARETHIPVRRHRRKDGTVFPVEISASFPVVHGRSCVVAMVRDITARRQTEEALRESEANFRSTFDAIGDFLIVGTPEGRILFTNGAVGRRLGYDTADLAKMHVLDLHPADLRAEAGEIFAAMFRGEREICPLPVVAKDGTLVPVETRVWFGRWSGRDCVFGLCKDLTAEQEAQQRFERLFRANPAPMAVSQLSDRAFVDVNEAFLKVLGYERAEIVGRTAAELGLFPRPDQQAMVASRLEAEGRIVDVELKVRAKNGALLDGLFSGEIIVSQGRRYFLTVMTDLTERKRSEAERKMFEDEHRRLQKAESLSRMAAAVAHHFNNQLHVVMGGMELALRDTPGHSAATDSLREAMKAARRAAEMSSLMLTYLGQPSGPWVTIDLGRACREGAKAWQAAKPPGAELAVEVTLPGPAVRANANQLRQVIGNLVTNATEALVGGVGKVTLKVDTVAASAVPAAHRFPPNWQPRHERYACLEVTDNGSGIPEKDLDRIFDPFFTTRFVGRGLGLAVVAGILRAHGGAITVRSAPGCGSTFRVFLPLGEGGGSSGRRN